MTPSSDLTNLAVSVAAVRAHRVNDPVPSDDNLSCHCEPCHNPTHGCDLADDTGGRDTGAVHRGCDTHPERDTYTECDSGPSNDTTSCDNDTSRGNDACAADVTSTCAPSVTGRVAAGVTATRHSSDTMALPYATSQRDIQAVRRSPVTLRPAVPVSSCHRYDTHSVSRDAARGRVTVIVIMRANVARRGCAC